MSSRSTGNPRSAAPRALSRRARTDRRPSPARATPRAARRPATGRVADPADAGRRLALQVAGDVGPRQRPCRTRARSSSVLNTAKQHRRTSSRADGSTTTSIPKGNDARQPRGERPRRPQVAIRPTTPPPIDQHETLDEQLPDDARASAAKRLADRDLLAPRRAARQQQVREVEACDQQHEHGHQHQQRRPPSPARSVSGRELTPTCGTSPDRERPVLVGGWILRSPGCRATPLSALSAAAARRPASARRRGSTRGSHGRSRPVAAALNISLTMVS